MVDMHVKQLEMLDNEEHVVAAVPAVAGAAVAPVRIVLTGSLRLMS